jgi:Lar family restriction alleviation protein
MTPVPKQCPFCGSTAVHISEDDTGHARWVMCEDCECDGPPIQVSFAKRCTKEQALEFVVNAWNKRSGE